MEKDTTINVVLNDINYIPSYKLEEEQRRSNEDARISNENKRISNEQQRINYYEEIEKKVNNGEFDGKDYVLTEEDKAEVVNTITKDANSIFNQNVEDKTKTYNDNADTKLSAYNTNASNNLSAYNTNAGTKLEAYNTNADSKMSSYNSNASSKLEEYNSNATAKKEEFNQNADSYNKRIVDNAKYLYNLIPRKTVKGQSVHITDSLHLPVLKLRVDGPRKQLTTKGQQFFDVSDVNEFSSGVSVDENDWITVTYDNSEGTTSKTLNIYTNVSDKLKVSTKYMLFLEIKSLTGDFGSIQVLGKDMSYKDSQFIDYNQFSFAEFVAGDIKIFSETTKDDFSSSKTMLKTRVFVDKGKSGSITFRLSVLEDTSITADTFVYEEYTGEQASPSPEYSQDIEVIEEDFDVTSCSKNLFNADKFIKDNFSNIVEVENGYTFDVTKNESIYMVENAKPNTAYTFKGRISSLIGADIYVHFYYTDGTRSFGMEIIKNGAFDTTFKIKTAETKTLQYIKFDMYGYGNYKTYTFQDFMLSEYDDDYEPYQETKVTFEIPEGEFFGSVSDTIKDEAKIVFNEEDGQYYKVIEKNIGKVILDGSDDEKWILEGSLTNTTRMRLENSSVGIAAPKSYLPSICSHFINDNEGNTYNRDTEHFYIGSSGSYFFIKKTLASTLAEFKALLSENNVTLYYPLAEPYTIDLGVVDPIETFEGTTNIKVAANLEPEIEVTYGQDFMKLIAAVSNQLL